MVTEALSYPGSARDPKAVGCGDFGKIRNLHVDAAAIKSSKPRGCDGWKVDDSVHNALVVDASRCGEVAHGILNVQ
jgi:hypothetical protein